MRRNGKTRSKSESNGGGSIDTKEKDIEAIKFVVKSDTLVIKRALIVQAKEKNEKEKENIFHTRCHIKEKVCNLIINGGSCANVVSSILVEKLNLPTLKHSLFINCSG